jgi:glycosyltransferase involved in cell wall biosynthesis
MKLSVIIPIYNGEKYIRPCIDSILNQLNDDVEIIVVNDGSVDNSAEIIQTHYSSQISSGIIKYFFQENAGVSVARNTAMSHAIGEYLAFVDADDLISDEYLSEILTALSKNSPDILEFGFKLFKDDEDPKNSSAYFVHSQFGALKKGQCINEIFAKSIWYPVIRVLRNSLLKESGIVFPPGVRFGEDIMMLTQVYDIAEDIIHIKKALYFYRLNSLSASFNLKEEYYSKIEDFYLSVIHRNELHFTLLKVSIFYNLYSFIRMTHADISKVNKKILKDMSRLRFQFLIHFNLLGLRRFRLAVFPRTSLFLDRIRKDDGFGLNKVKRK